MYLGCFNYCGQEISNVSNTSCKFYSDLIADFGKIGISCQGFLIKPCNILFNIILYKCL